MDTLSVQSWTIGHHAPDLDAIAGEVLAAVDTADILTVQHAPGELAAALVDVLDDTHELRWCPRTAGQRRGGIAISRTGLVAGELRASFPDAEPGRHATGQVAHVLTVDVNGDHLTIISAAFTTADVPDDVHPARRQAAWLTGWLTETERSAVILAIDLPDPAPALPALSRHGFAVDGMCGPVLVAAGVDLDVQVATADRRLGVEVRSAMVRIGVQAAVA